MMRRPIKWHHKAGATVSATVVADKAFDAAKEHLTVAVHDWVAHLGYSWILIAGCAGFVLIPIGLHKYFRKGDDNGKED